MTFKETILQEALELFHQEGIKELDEPQLLQKLDISAATYREMFDSKEDLLKQMVHFDIQMQKERNIRINKKATNAIEELLMRLEEGIKTLKEMNPAYFIDLMQHYPETWQIYMNNMDTSSNIETSALINRGVLEGHFRKDLNIQLVTKIMLEQVRLLINPQIFPPEKFSLSEVFRSIFLYYIRGICSEQGSKMADEHFAKVNIS